jgi:hypothetical protein
MAHTPMLQLLHTAGRHLLIAAMLLTMGGHLAVLQTIAWGNMLIEYSRSASITEAADKTFDGEHPCHLCKVVKESRKQEEKKTLVKAESKMDVTLPLPVRLKEPIGQTIALAVPPYRGRDSEVCLGVPLQPPREVCPPPVSRAS